MSVGHESRWVKWLSRQGRIVAKQGYSPRPFEPDERCIKLRRCRKEEGDRRTQITDQHRRPTATAWVNRGHMIRDQPEQLFIVYGRRRMYGGLPFACGLQCPRLRMNSSQCRSVSLGWINSHVGERGSNFRDGRSQSLEGRRQILAGVGRCTPELFRLRSRLFRSRKDSAIGNKLVEDVMAFRWREMLQLRVCLRFDFAAS